ncbi:nucleoid DNA-binding protein [Dysgonomonas alginatilytica]|uniref:Nucleoid DNA-binding protein n=1 Tax=Dysgonomonas alginatilytica TaxID=1605892 RepID=A0A2V3PNE8_9BACT|nr:HU family DNA-binding protein [Dysgonomonas alginatilytica]PXV62640.1 nucleoid DNA-binding protein [Dysgonomonas alginatilytica]
MNDKLSLQDLVDVLSKKAKITKKDADSFFRELFQLILERIFDNDSVKIKDFGTFKLISVSSRESVNVNTGEKIEIPSHYKLSFIPDKILKNLVNKPFSQFETILLEDGVVFETSVENEESISEDEIVESSDIDMENEDDDIVSEIEKPIIAESASIIVTTNNTPVREKDTEETNPEKESKPQNSSKQIYPRSFVYTYTTSKPSEESDSITLTVPKEDLVRSVSIPKPEEKEPELPVQKVSEQKEFPIELLDLPHVPMEETKEEVDIEEEVDTYDLVEDEPKKIEEKAVDAIQSEDDLEEPSQSVLLTSEFLSKNVISDDLELESDLDSEIETEEDIIIPVPIPIIDRLVKEGKEPVDTSEAQSTAKEEKKSVFSNEDPERPLFPVEEDDVIADSDFVALDEPVNKVAEISEEDKRRVNPSMGDMGSYAGNNKPAETRSVSFSNTIDPVDIPYHDFNSPYLGSKFRRWLPMGLFLLVIVAFLTYGLIKMLNKPYDFEYNLGRTNLTLSDTLPFVDEVSPKVQATDAMLDSMKRLQAEGLKDSVTPVKKEPIAPIAKKPAVEQKVEAAKPGIVGDADSLTRDLINKEKNGFVISDKLKFGILNKAEFHLAKYQKESKAELLYDSKEKTQPESKASSNSKPKYDTIKRGTTLRTLAATHYGNPDYWVYIYQANKKNIANPNNVPIGTSLLIPPLSDYGVYNPSDAREIQVAKNLEAKILEAKILRLR